MKILFTICGRAGSKGIKNKNIRNFAGKPLPYYSLSAIDLYLKKNQNIEYDLVVNSDSDILLQMMQDNHLRPLKLINRDISLSGDDIGKIIVVNECLEKMEKLNNTNYDIVVDLDITSPLRTVNDIEKLINVHMIKHPDLTTSVVPARRNPFFNQLIQMDKGVKRVIDSSYTARQQAPMIYDMNASLYAYSPKHLRSGKALLDGYVEIIEMFDTGILDLDNENDFDLMEIIAEYLFQNIPEYGKIRENIC